MRDQAESLRKLVEDKTHHSLAKVIAIASGKGGVGKTNVSLNFAIALSQLGKKVVLFDLDIGMANVDIMLGTSSTYHIVDMIEHNMSIWDIIETGPDNLSYVSGGSGFTKFFKLNSTKFQRFVDQLEMLQGQFDYILLDMGAGISEDSIQFILAADEIMLVTTPEPTSITDAYAMIKFIHSREPNLPFSIVVNRVESSREGEATAENLQRVAKQFLQKKITTLGYLPNDKIVTKAVRSQHPFLLLDPKAKPSISIKEIAQSYIGEQQETDTPFVSSFIYKVKRFFKER